MNRASTLLAVMGTLALLAPFVPSAMAGPPQQLQVEVAASSPVYAGQKVEITATVQLDNGSAAGTITSFAGSKLFYPNGTAITLGAPTIVVAQLAEWTYTLPANAPDGLYSITIRASLAGFNASWALGSFTVNSQIASKSGLTSIMTQLTGISTQLTGMSTQLGTISRGLAGNFSALMTATSTDYSALSALVGALSPKLGSIAANMKANFTTITNNLSTDYNSLMTSVTGGFGRVTTTLGTLSSDIKGNLTVLGSSIQALRNSLGTLATSVSISSLNSTVISGFGGLNSALANLASSAQAADLKTAIQSLGSQAALISNIQTYLLLPVAIIALILLVFVIFRKKGNRPAST